MKVNFSISYDSFVQKKKDTYVYVVVKIKIQSN